MAPSTHPPCTPSASCTLPRCHPSLPTCSRPEKCLATTTKKGVRPCQSAVSIMATRSKQPCSECAKYAGKDTSNPRKVAKIEKYLKRKSMERKLRKKDRLHGTHSYLRYQRRHGTPRPKTECCAGKGHRGRLKRHPCRHCCAKCCGAECRECCLQCCDECCCPCCGTCCSRYCTIL